MRQAVRRVPLGEISLPQSASNLGSSREETAQERKIIIGGETGTSRRLLAKGLATCLGLDVRPHSIDQSLLLGQFRLAVLLTET